MSRFLIALLLLFMNFDSVSKAQASEPITVKLPEHSVTVKVDHQKDLSLSVDSREGIPFLPELPDVTDLYATRWIGDGLFLVVGVEDFPATRSYNWMTMLVRDQHIMSDQTELENAGFWLLAKGQIFGSTDPLKLIHIGAARGDRVDAFFLDESEIPGTDRKLVIWFRHDCPRLDLANAGITSRLYLTPKGIEDVSNGNVFERQPAE
ncbi:hypothetical protein SH661x_000303 [Planctomicrobium sp. SH661]|uniref:hypothetical protein n=1 Tax=Planctomicrobium sp. SH661 TaxID=3448124 RepID=UPI003F5CBB02